MTIFACFRGKTVTETVDAQGPCPASQRCVAQPAGTTLISDKKPVTSEPQREISELGLLASCSINEKGRRWVNDAHIKLVQALSTLEGGWWTCLSEVCQAACEHLQADHACIYVLSQDEQWAYTTACAGLASDTAAGRPYGCDPRFNHSSVAAVLRLHQASPGNPLIFRSANLRPTFSDSAAIHQAQHKQNNNSKPAVADAEAAVSVAAVTITPKHSVDGKGRRVGVSGQASAVSSSGGVLGSSGGCSEELPADWQMLVEEGGCAQFAAVGLVGGGGDVVGVLSLATRAASRPRCWTPEALFSIAALLAPPLRRAASVLSGSAYAALHAADTLGELVVALGEAAVEVALAVGHTRGNSRVAFVRAQAGYAAIFQSQVEGEGEGPTGGVGRMVPPQLRARGRSSCEYVGRPVSGVRRKSSLIPTSTTATPNTIARVSMELLSGAGERNVAALNYGLKSRESWTPQPRAPSCASFSMPPAPKGLGCRGHTVALDRSLLSEALSRGAAGLWIDDCHTYTLSNKAYPRDLVITRGSLPPTSLALAALAPGGAPLMALYITYDNAVAPALLQAVVGELEQLLEATLPVVLSKLSGPIHAEYEYLCAALQEASALRPHTPSGTTSFPPNSIPSDPCRTLISPPSVMDPVLPGVVAAADTPGGGAAAAGSYGTGGSVLTGSGAITGEAESQLGYPTGTEPTRNLMAFLMRGILGPASPQLSPTASPSLPPAPAGAAHSPTALSLKLKRSETAAADGEAARQAAAAAAAAAVGSVHRGISEVDGGGRIVTVDGAMETRRRRGSVDWALSAVGGVGRPQSACESGVNGASVTARRLLASTGALRSVSFRLEAAQMPRGASKLAPLIVSMHDRLRAAQAAQMTLGRSEARLADLASLRLLQQIGQGGYGTVYRGTYHGTEVAVKIIKQSSLAAIQHGSAAGMAAGPGGGGGGSAGGLGVTPRHLHDAIELVASVSMSHTNIVQVPAYFMDVRLEKPEPFNPLDSIDGPSEVSPFRLAHCPTGLESTAPGEAHGASDCAMALVLEFCDCGSLCDAISSRTFIEKVTPKKSLGSGPPKTYLAINMRSVYATLLEVALALRHMHGLHLVHCDLKPQNVLLKSSPRDPRGFTAKLSDFGLAKMMAHDESGRLVIDDTVGSGTITHVAPEVLLGESSLGAAVDIYAFGILMFQVLCGMKVYDKNLSASAIAAAVAHKHMRPSLPDWVPVSYRSLAQRCWSHDPAERPTAEELVRQLERFLESRRTPGVSGPGNGVRSLS